MFIDVHIAEDDRPLTEADREQYKLPQLDMFDRLPLSTILDRLRSHGCISGEHVAAVTLRDTQRQQVTTLLDIMARRSLTHCKQFLDIVHKGEQQSVVDQRETGGETSVFYELCLKKTKPYARIISYQICGANAAALFAALISLT